MVLWRHRCDLLGRLVLANGRDTLKQCFLPQSTSKTSECHFCTVNPKFGSRTSEHPCRSFLAPVHPSCRYNGEPTIVLLVFNCGKAVVTYHRGKWDHWGCGLVEFADKASLRALRKGRVLRSERKARIHVALALSGGGKRRPGRIHRRPRKLSKPGLRASSTSLRSEPREEGGSQADSLVGPSHPVPNLKVLAGARCRL